MRMKLFVSLALCLVVAVVGFSTAAPQIGGGGSSTDGGGSTPSASVTDPEMFDSLPAYSEFTVTAAYKNASVNDTLTLNVYVHDMYDNLTLVGSMQHTVSGTGTYVFTIPDTLPGGYYTITAKLGEPFTESGVIIDLY